MHGPGRVSNPGSLVAYVLGITKINPMEHGLIFERFINPVRKIQPDFDIDFESNRLSEVVEISKEFYGKQNVARIAVYISTRSKIAISMAAKKIFIEGAVQKGISKNENFLSRDFCKLLDL